MGIFRFFLSLSVLVWHLPERTFALVHAGIAVIVFFMISGFYITMILNENYTGSQNVVRFYKSRFFRIYPAYILCLLFILTYYCLSGVPNVFCGPLDMPLSARVVIAFSNVFIIGQDLFQTILTSHNFGESNPIADYMWNNYHRPVFNTHWMLIGQAWSIGIEILFYMIAPFVVKSLQRLIFCFIISLIARVFVIKFLGFSSEVWGYYFFPASLVFFFMGSLSYYLYKKFDKFYSNFYAISVAVVSALGLVLLSLYYYNGILLIHRSSGYDTKLLWFFYTILVVLIPVFFHCTKKSKWDKFIGDFSYPLYLVHGFCIFFVLNEFNVKISEGAISISVFLSMLVAFLMLLLVDQPIDQWRKRFKS